MRFETSCQLQQFIELVTPFFPKYADSIIYSQIFSLSLLSIIAIPADTYFMAKEKVKEQYIAIIGGFLIQISILSLGVMWGGLIGLVVARTIIKILWGFQSIVLYKFSSRKVASSL